MAVYFLSQHPEVLRRLREEILAKVGPERRPDYSDIREMKYLRAVINGQSTIYLTDTVTEACTYRDLETAPGCVSNDHVCQ